MGGQKGDANGVANGAHSAPEFEFFGPHVPGVLVFVLPMVLYGLIYACNESGCMALLPSPSVPGFAPSMELFSFKALFVYLAWFFGLACAHLLAPGRLAQGTVQPNGERLTYKLNAFTLFCLTYLPALYFGFFTDLLNLSWVYDNYLPLLTASVLFSASLSVYLYASSHKKGALLSEHGTTGYPHYDFWMGRELNPRLGMFDWKEFCELYPGIIGWALANLAMAHKQRQRLGYVTPSMVLTNVFQLYYVVDALWNEKSILTTMDITTDGFGYMLAFGDLAWVPFGFSNAARFLADHPQNLSAAMIVVILAVKALGYYIFRGANGQKDAFRRDPSHPSVAHLKTLPTERGTKLICSGWWGVSRHVNYFGDWIMGLAWCLPTGLAGACSVTPYFYCLYFAVLLAHRERRDDEACRRKYGADWEKYCKLVPWRIIPYVY
uniref:Delta(14)-sterol reductase ERG24 n=1 Tax=Chlamydomonas euryale TaxID=1486919 RepID=A0A7R9UZT7_9CHLO|mmetsp:Transcript_11400/g.33838  ORF Transcript_11400/g.33838 Transcript_11400/m.33838 type:complete len:436 (+) Transcript_11400:336-1643(+)